MLSNPTAAPGAHRKQKDDAQLVSSPGGALLATVCELDVSVSHADRRFAASVVQPDESPLLAALVALRDLGDVSLCTPARRIRSL